MAVLHRHRQPGFWTPQRVPTEAVEVDRSHPLAQGLQGLWLLNQPNPPNLTGLSSAATSGNAPPLVSGLHGAPVTSLNGSTHYVDTGSGTLVDAIQTITVACWINISAAGNYPGIIAKASAWTQGNYYDISFNGGGSTPVWGQNNVLHVGTNAIPLNTWTHLAVTNSATANVIYINGAQDSSFSAIAAPPAGTANTWKVGGYLTSGGNGFFPGSVESFHLYNRALSASEIASLFTDSYSMLRPVARRTYGFSSLPATVTGTPWYQAFGLPVWPLRGLAGFLAPQPIKPVSLSAEAVSVDRWLRPLSQPQSVKPGFRGDFAFWSGFTPVVAQSVSIGWFAPLSQPVARTTSARGNSVFWSGFTPAPLPPAPNGWLQQLSQPTMQARQPQHQSFAVGYNIIITVSIGSIFVIQSDQTMVAFGNVFGMTGGSPFVDWMD